MKVYQPQCQVTLIKSRWRTQVAGQDGSGAMPANSSRYRTDPIIDLTPFLSDAGVRLQKSVREPAGAFSIGLTPRPHPDHLETLDMLIEPMDMVEIRMAHEPPKDGDDKNDWPPVVMRGFVSSITKSESIANGNPQRSIMISGQDYGKIWQIMQIYYLNNSVMGDNIIGQLKFFQKWVPEGAVKMLTVLQFLDLLVSSVMAPYLEAITALDTRKGGMPKSIVLKSSIEGLVSPFGFSNASDMSLYQLLAQYVDIGPFNELYIEDVGADVVMVARPQPVWRSDGTLYSTSDALPETVEIGLGDVASTQLSRSDTGVYNIFEVENSRVMWFNQEDYKLLSMDTTHGHPLRLADENQQAKYFGERRLKVSTTLNNPALVEGDAKKKEGMPEDSGTMLSWLADRRERLVQLNRDSSVLEKGSLRLKGNHKLRAGMRLKVKHSSALTVSYYVPAVSHEFIPGSGFFTTAQVERGDGFVLSAGLETAPDLMRRDLGGVK